MEHRILDQPMMCFSIPEETARIRSGAQWRASQKGSITLAKNHELRIVLIVLSKGMGLDEHQAEGQITVSVAQGSIRFKAGSDQRTLLSGGLLTLGSGIRHAVEALEDSAFLITLVHGEKAL
jgi:quercetin dioxygenase-like cupin family protein